MKVQFDFIAYMLDVATRLKEIEHTATTPHFHRVTGIASLEELAENAISTEGMQLCVQDTPEGTMFDNNTNLFLDDRYYVWYILKNVSSNSMEERRAVVAECETVFKKIVSKITKDYLNDHSPNTDKKGLLYHDRNTIKYQTVGPVGSKYHGLMVMMTVPETFSYAYDSDDWEPEE